MDSNEKLPSRSMFNLQICEMRLALRPLQGPYGLHGGHVDCIVTTNSVCVYFLYVMQAGRALLGVVTLVAKKNHFQLGVQQGSKLAVCVRCRVLKVGNDSFHLSIFAP